MNGVRPTVILYGKNAALSRGLREWPVRKADHLIALLDEIRACIVEFGAHDGHAVVCDVRGDDDALALLLRLRRTTVWSAPVLVLHGDDAPPDLREAARTIGGFSLVDSPAQLPAALDKAASRRAAGA